MQKEFFSAVAIGLTIMAFLPYIRSIQQGKTKPHVFSWIIWGTTTFIIFLAQLSDHGGAGAWPIGISGIITLYIAVLAYRKKADSMISRTDCWFFSLAMTALPFWYFTSEPLWAVLILTTVDLLGFAPTFRKAFINPFDEQMSFFVILGMRNFISIVALENYSLTTIIFPATLGIACLAFTMTVIYIRRTTPG